MKSQRLRLNFVDRNESCLSTVVDGHTIANIRKHSIAPLLGKFNSAT